MCKYYQMLLKVDHCIKKRYETEMDILITGLEHKFP